MRIVFITQIPRSPSQPEVRPFEMEAARALARRVPVTVLAVAQDAEGEAPGREDDGVEVVRPRMRRVPGGRLTLQAAAMSLAIVPWVRRIAGGDRVVLHAQFGCPAGVAAAWAGQRLGLPVVVTFRGSDVAEAPRHADLRAATRWAVRRASRVVAVAHHIVPGLRALGAAEGAVRVVYDGVDRTAFRPASCAEACARLGLDPSMRRVLYAGRLVEGKGVGDLLRAHAALGERVRLVLAGGGGGAWIERTIRALGSGARVDRHGEVAYAAVADWMNACDVVCLPSRAEGRPSAALEARACLRPVAATDIPGHRETLEGYAGARWARAADPADLARSVAAAFASAAPRAEPGWNPPSWADTSSNLLDLYRGIE